MSDANKPETVAAAASTTQVGAKPTGDEPVELMSFLEWFVGWLSIMACSFATGAQVIGIMHGAGYLHFSVGLTVEQSRMLTPFYLAAFFVLCAAGYVLFSGRLSLFTRAHLTYPYHYFWERIVGWYEVACICRHEEVMRQFSKLWPSAYLKAYASGKVRRTWCHRPSGYACPACGNKNIILIPLFGWFQRWNIQLLTASNSGRRPVTFLKMRPHMRHTERLGQVKAVDGYDVMDQTGATLFFYGLEIMLFFKPQSVFAEGRNHFGNDGWNMQRGWANALVLQNEWRESYERFYREASKNLTNTLEDVTRLQDKLREMETDIRTKQNHHTEDLVMLFSIVSDTSVKRLPKSPTVGAMIEVLLERLNPLLVSTDPLRSHFERFYEMFLGRKAQSETDRRLALAQKMADETLAEVMAEKASEATESGKE